MAGNKRGAVFTAVGSLRPERSAHDLSHRKLTTDDMGRLIPITNFTGIPGDTITIYNQVVVRMQPMYAPLFHEVNCYCHWWFVPWRIIWDQWENYITGGRSGTLNPPLPLVTAVSGPPAVNYPNVMTLREGELFDYLYGIAFPQSEEPDLQSGISAQVTPDVGVDVLAFPLYAYNKIYNDNYRDENSIDPVPLYDRNFKLRAWEKDYFTSALPDQQRGNSPAFPLNGVAHATFYGYSGSGAYIAPNQTVEINPGTTNATALGLSVYSSAGAPSDVLFKGWLNQNNIPMDTIPTFDVSDLRDAFQLQKYLERNMRAGSRYTEWLRARFGVSPRDERLDRPEYIGGSKQPIVTSEVLQTSESGVTPQATMAGHGISADNTFIGKYHVQEYGTIMCMLSVMPRSMYQQGISKQDVKRSKYEFPIPEFAHVSERALETFELYSSLAFDTVTGPVTQNSRIRNTTIFGYVGMYDEYRYMPSRVHASFKSGKGSLDYWHLGRLFANVPYLNRSFIECNPASTKRIYNVQTTNGLMISFGAGIKAVRPLPFIAEPGLLDHF